MKVTEQIDALRALAIDPVGYLVVPRVIAMVVMMFLLVVIGDLTALIGGAVTSQYLLGVDVELFAWSIITFIHLDDLIHGLLKALAFGVAVALISCYRGLTASGGAVGVGRAVNSSVVGSAIAIFVLDYLITFLHL
jgi:phospholipid/cholesterol/gamma-HCH transport system permease protein